MAAECEITDDHGPCGVAALGRCKTCRRAFCLSHQGRDYYGNGYVNWCLACQRAKGVEDAAKKTTEEEAAKKAEEEKIKRAEAVAVECKSLVNKIIATGLPGARRVKASSGKERILEIGRGTVYISSDGHHDWDFSPTGHVDCQIAVGEISGLLRSTNGEYWSRYDVRDENLLRLLRLKAIALKIQG